jgi:hypothetical protein
MDQESIVYGVVRDQAFGTQMERRVRRSHNRQIIESLPDADGWPFICREMFGISGFDEMGGTYQTQVIHFGASYRAIEYEWELWMKKFESVLMQMYWVSAKVHLETELSGVHTFIWEATSDCHEPGGAIQVRCEWEREGGIVSRRR